MARERRPRRLKAGDGYVLFQHFELIRSLGRGNFASVYQVRRKADGRDYALKHIDITAMDPSEYADLVNEIRLMAAVQHPNLLTYYEAFVDRAQLFVVTELAAEGDLGALLGKLDRRREGLPETQVWRLFLQMAAGLRYLHHSKVLHGDMKPENVLLTEDGLLKVADFGISQVLTHVFTRVLMGTPQYVAPEAWRGKPYSFSADVWALGCVLHELCTRRPLFLPRGRPSDREIREKVLEGRVTPISRKYSPDLWNLIKKLLTQNPAARPTLDEIMELEMVQARMHLLPAEVRAWLESPERCRAVLPGLFRISANPDNWPQLNSVLPPAKYDVGQGVAEQLRLPRPSSCPDLAAPAEQAAATQSPSPSGSSVAGPSSLFRFSAAYPKDQGWTGRGMLRRVSMSVAVGAQVLPLAALQHGAAAAAAAAGAQQQHTHVQQQAHVQQQQQQGGPVQAAAAVQPLRRCKSMSDVMRVKPRESEVVACSHWGQLWGFDPSPLEFGARARAGGKASGAAAARSAGRGAGGGPAAQPGMSLADYKWGGGGYAGTESYAGSSYGGSLHGGGSYYEASYHGGRNNRGTGSHAGSYHGGSYHGGSYRGGGDYYDSSYHGGSYQGSLGGSHHGGSYYEPSIRGGFGSARAAAARQQKPAANGGSSSLGGFKAKLKRLLFGKSGT